VTLSAVMEILKAEAVLATPDSSAELTGCFASDLMSDVLAFARRGSVLLTGLASDQTVRTAAVLHLAAVVVVQGKEIGTDMREAAREEEIPLYRTPLSKYEACGLLMQAGLRPYRKGVDLPV
jgi:hypothetical protein